MTLLLYFGNNLQQYGMIYTSNRKTSSYFIDAAGLCGRYEPAEDEKTSGDAAGEWL